MNNREKAKAVQKKFNQRLGIYYGVIAASVIVAAIGLMTQINVLTLLGVVAFFAGLVILSWVDGYTEYAKRVMTAKALMDEEMPEDVVNAGIELVKKQGGSLSALKSQRVLSYFISSVPGYFHRGSHAGEDPRTEVCIRYCTEYDQESLQKNQSVVRGLSVCKIRRDDQGDLL